MTNYNIAEEVENIKVMVNLLQWFFIWGGLTFFASHIIIIINLPKIRRLCEEMCYEGDEKEEFKEKQSKEHILSLILFAVCGIAIGIFIMCMFL